MIVPRLLLTVVTLAACASPPVPRVEIATADGTATFAVEIVEDGTARAQGLAGRAALPQGAGMAFLWPEDTDVPFHMKDVPIPLDVAFIRADGTIARILEMAPCGDAACPVYAPGVRYRWALEVNAGAFDRYGVREGDRARLVR